MKIDYSFTSDDLRACWNHCRGYTSNSIKNARVLYFVAPMIGLALFLTGAFAGYSRLQTRGEVLFVAALVGIPIHIAFDKWKCHKWIKCGFPKGAGGETYSLTADDEGLVVALPGLMESRMNWNAITNFAQNRIITVFYLRQDCFYVPTNAMTSNQRAELSDLVARHVQKRKV